MSKHKVQLWPVPAKKYTSKDSVVPMIVIGEEHNAFNHVVIQLDGKLDSKIPDGQPLEVYVCWED
ncbi:hypothetical protein [Leuconostoc mesenteroides]|uniref:hypothetical protein n=1 Tax=Leuconostoc mesenteroides TaxID=1245 RepID=UPI002361CEDA|nr:hypothetical protein [Leuconostoc mesenteroides]